MQDRTVPVIPAAAPPPAPALDTQRSLSEARQALAHSLRLPAAPPVPEVWSMRLSLVGAALSLAASASLLAPALAAGSRPHIASFSAYGLGLVAMFLASAAFHHRAGRPRRQFKNLDYCAIGLTIAGTFTPFCVLTRSGAPCYGALALVWALAAGGAALRLARPELPKRVFVAFFLAGGWAAGAAAWPALRLITPACAVLLLLGGAVYSAGTVFFNRYDGEVEPPGFGQHEIWHLCILAAAACHFLAIRLSLAPGGF